MPNWCDNQITITGPNSVIDKIEKIVNDESNNIENGLLQFFHPMPKELMETEKSSDDKKMNKQPFVDGVNNWYDWRVNNWGTKWELCEFYGVDRQYLTEQSEGESTISFSFSSAWAPPIGAYEKFLENNSNCFIRAYYYEGGCDFMGLWEDGVDDCYQPSDYKSTDDFWEDGIGSTLDDVFNITESMAEYEAELERDRLDEDVYKYSKGEKINIGEEA